MSASGKLWTPLKIGDVEVQHRVAMAPLTRFRADDEHVPIVDDSVSVAEYYAQRASLPGTLLITEATFISPEAGGYDNAPGIWNKAQIESWKKVTDAVHAKKSFIYLQMWALGRVATPANLERDGFKVKGPSPIPAEEGGHVPEELTEEEIQTYIQNYVKAAKNAIEAGFDGVEIHGANGYLIDQFTQDTANQRTDKWGGSVENRARFGIEVAKAVTAAVGSEKVGYRMGPYSTFQGMRMADPVPQFTYLTKELKKLNLAYLHIIVTGLTNEATEEDIKKVDFAVNAWGDAPVLLAGSMTEERAKQWTEEIFPNKSIVIVFGRYYISTPDLPFRLKHGIPFNKYVRDTFYIPKSAKGYTDYPFSEEYLAAQKEGKL